MPEKKLTQLFQLLQTHIVQLEIISAEGVFLEVVDGLGLGLYAFELVLFVEVVDAVPGGNGGGVCVDVVYEEGPTEGKDLDYDKGLDSVDFLPHSAFESELLLGQSAVVLALLPPDGQVCLVVPFECSPALPNDQLGLLRIHFELLIPGRPVLFFNFVQLFLAYVAV